VLSWQSGSEEKILRVSETAIVPMLKFVARERLVETVID
jgi:hypothetical protein